MLEEIRAIKWVFDSIVCYQRGGMNNWLKNAQAHVCSVHCKHKCCHSWNTSIRCFSSWRWRPESWSALRHWIRIAKWAGFQLHPSIPKWHTEDAGSDGTQMAASLFIALPQLPEDIWKLPTLAVSSTTLSSHHAWFKDGWKQWAGLGRCDHMFYWQWLTEAQAVGWLSLRGYI